MLKIFWQKLSTTTSGGAVLIAFFTIISKLLGLVRDRLLASTFGAGALLDTYYAAFKLPDLIFNTLVLGALAAAFIPVFTKLWLIDKERALRVANTVLNYLLLILLVLLAVVWLLADRLVPLFTPGFSLEQWQQTVVLTRIMLLSIVFFGISNVFGGILNSLRRFLTFSLAPVFYNLGIILGITAFWQWWGIEGLAWGVVFGSLLHFLIQLPETLKAGWFYQWAWRVSGEVKKIFRLMVPRMLGMATQQVNLLVITIIASSLSSGSLAIFNLANNLQSLPSSIFGVSLAIAVFPVFSEALALKDHTGFVSAFSLHFRRILFLIIPVSVLLLLLRAQIVRVVLGSGQFDWSDTYFTAQSLGWFVISLFAQSLIPMVARTFYALEDTKTPVMISILAISLNIVGSIFLGPVMGVEGLALAFSVAAILQLLILMVVLRLRVGYLDDKKIIWSIFKISVNSLLSGAIIYLMLRIMAGLVDMRTFWGIFTQGLVAGVVGLIFYLALGLLTNCQEISIVKHWLRRYLRPLVK